MGDRQQVAVILAEGFEEIEAVTPIDILRRGGVEVIVASLTPKKEVTGAHGLMMKADQAIGDLDISQLEMVILPGGMPGSKNLAQSTILAELLREVYGQNGYLAAICAAPMALDQAGLLIGRKMTCYPGVEKQLQSGEYLKEKVVVDQRIITSAGPATAMEFSFEILKQLGRGAQAQSLRQGMLVEC